MQACATIVCMDWDQRKEKIRTGELLEVIRDRPALYLGERSLSALWHYLLGYRMAMSVYDVRADFSLPADFHEWVAYRLHFYESTSGYRNMILKRTPDESVALDHFFELLDDHRTRKPRVVALAQCNKQFTSYTGKDAHRENVQTRKIPSPLKLIAYTDDPGFFVASDSAEDFPRKDCFFPTIKAFGGWYDIVREDLTVVDAHTFDRYVTIVGATLEIESN